ncbi:MAG: aspartyl protease [Okeania sp. SIO3I5]|uniref:aspartyl protease n=1 Tax=Okeania sp. SIO3I5 TaxID=2607805 RepID=UPI0013B8DD7B|nr:aspartyl protease [Okeania sp. SIO3I5]NEQ36569.1 aspartyl protease [Okeania sp. SIO3I5]
MLGKFGNNGELFFEIELVTVTGEKFLVETLLDTGFTTGWLAINSQDLEALQWPLVAPDIEMKTAKGNETFDIHQGLIIIDGEQMTIPVHVGQEVPEFLIGSQWLEIMELTVNKPEQILKLSKIVQMKNLSR